MITDQFTLRWGYSLTNIQLNCTCTSIVCLCRDLSGWDKESRHSGVAYGTGRGICAGDKETGCTWDSQQTFQHLQKVWLQFAWNRVQQYEYWTSTITSFIIHVMLHVMLHEWYHFDAGDVDMYLLYYTLKLLRTWIQICLHVEVILNYVMRK